MLYESVIHSITIISTLPSPGVGALLLLMAGHIDPITIVCLILLIRIIKKNDIMLVDFALQAEENEGLTTEQAIYQAASSVSGPS